ncbi:2Fe-2S ferredoxin-type domain-containing protein [Tribonema minus]|uniref:2Fe-2S ferredoxin-type domain-containing protein n=1 Tax=Tribonema minus TaxID=303371 RepID=A0A836CGC2_9STRA|nr:2Fe-2S ferredoxin-type domain-containing protein [Tribonema minus]
MPLYARSMALAGACGAVMVSAAAGFVMPSASRSIVAQQRRQTNSVARRPRGLYMHQVTIEVAGKSHTLEVDEKTSVLEAALDAGIELPHDCKLGVCLTCPSKIVSGEVDQDGTTLDDSVVEQGYALTCCSFPRSDLVIRAIDEDELVGAQFEGRE